MVDKKTIDLNEFRTATQELGESVPLLSNGHPVTGIDIRRIDGDLQVNLLSQDVIAPEAPLVPVPEASLAPAGHEPRDMAPEVDDVDATEDLADPRAEYGENQERFVHLTERRKNDPASLSADERKELAHLEKLAGVEEQRKTDPADGPGVDPL